MNRLDHEKKPRQNFLIKASILAAMALGLAASMPASAHNDHPLGREVVEWENNPAILRTLANNFNWHGGNNTVSWRPNGHVEKMGDRECVVGPHFLFDIDDNYAFDIDETVTLEILFDRTASTGFQLSYDQAVNPVTKSITFDGQKSERWHRETVTLERARFANRLLDKTDFSISAPNAKVPPADWKENHEVAICDIQVTRENKSEKATQMGRLELMVNEPSGDPATVRAGLYEPDGKMPLASKDAVTLSRFGEKIRELPLLTTPRNWPAKGRFAFYINGSYSAELAPGEYTLVLAKGPEYRIITLPVRVKPGKTTQLEVTLERWADMPSKGWFSGDDHIHIGRDSQSMNPMILAYTRAEDIHVANLLQMANLTNSHFKQYHFGEKGHYQEGGYALVSGQESPRTTHRGHTIGLNAKHFHWPGDDYYLYDKTAKSIREEGGMWGYAHVAVDAFNVAWGLALDVPLGSVDFLELLQMSTMNTEYLYDFLNMGFKALPSAGSDYPYMHVAGAERIYAKLDKPFTVQNWFDSWRNNRSFVSNGPIIDFTLNGDDSVQEVDVAAGTLLTVKAKASINPDYDQLERLELVVHGKVVASVTANKDSENLDLEYSFLAGEPIWFALRAYGKGTGKAHTAPVYVYVDGNQRFYNRESVAALAKKYLGYLAQLRQSIPDMNKEWEHFDVADAVLPKWEDDKPELNKRIELAREIYEILIKESHGE